MVNLLDVEKKTYRLADRFKEPSSWAPIAGSLAVLGIKCPDPVLQAVVLLGAGVAGLLAFFLPEKAKA